MNMVDSSTWLLGFYMGSCQVLDSSSTVMKLYLSSLEFSESITNAGMSSEIEFSPSRSGEIGACWMLSSDKQLRGISEIT